MRPELAFGAVLKKHRKKFDISQECLASKKWFRQNLHFIVRTRTKATVFKNNIKHCNLFKRPSGTTYPRDTVVESKKRHFMIITIRNNIPIASLALIEQINLTITNALNNIKTVNDQFEVNDTIWFARKRKGGVSPCVVNSAAYLSKTFQKNLATFDGWQGETKLNDQNFDGFGEFKISGTANRINEVNIVPFLHEYIKVNNDSEHLIYPYFSLFYGMYFKRKLFNISHIPDELHHFFDEEEFSGNIRIGVEFETGNIGSSFRAIMKLNSLFMSNYIDLGIFITSSDKDNSAGRIWPISNRNGSFIELENRHFRDSVQLPLLEVSFQPDLFDANAPYLGEQGSTYLPTDTGNTITESGQIYKVYLGNNKDEILIPVDR